MHIVNHLYYNTGKSDFAGSSDLQTLLVVYLRTLLVVTLDLQALLVVCLQTSLVVTLVQTLLVVVVCLLNSCSSKGMMLKVWNS